MSVTQDIRLAARHRKESAADLRRRIADMEHVHKAELARRDHVENQLICALRKACSEVDTQTAAVNAAVAISAGRAEEIRGLKDKLRVQAGKVTRRDADLRRLSASLHNAHLELKRVKPRVTAANNPARIPPYAPTDPGDWTVIDATGQAITFGTGTWMPFPRDPDGETTVGIALADVLAGLA